LEAIESGLKSVGATKQANTFSSFKKLFAGRPGASLAKFVEEVSMSTPSPDLGAPRFKRVNLDHAKDISNRLTAPCLDPQSFEAIMELLRSPVKTDTATLALIANLSLGNRRVYRDRKMTLAAMEKHFRAQVSRAIETSSG
jgi:hypothetical protein